MLNFNPDKRPNAEQALKNKWLNYITKNNDQNEIILDENIISNLTKFHSSITLQKASLAFIANQVGQNEEVQKLKAEFDKIDCNKDGVLTKEELIECNLNITYK